MITRKKRGSIQRYFFPVVLSLISVGIGYTTGDLRLIFLGPVVGALWLRLEEKDGR